MTRLEFGMAMNYLAEAVDVQLPAQRCEVYFDLLGDLDFEVIQMAVKKAVLSHPWRTFPSVAELRQAAVDILTGHLGILTSLEAWGAAWDAVKRIDLEIPHTIKNLDKLDDLTRRCVLAFGVPDMTSGKSSVEWMRKNFMCAYEQMAQHEMAKTLLPLSLVKSIEAFAPSRSIAHLTQKTGLVSL